MLTLLVFDRSFLQLNFRLISGVSHPDFKGPGNLRSDSKARCYFQS